jgi:membrane protein
MAGAPKRDEHRRSGGLAAASRAVRGGLDLLRTAAVEWWNDDTFQLAAALAFYTIFSLAPLVVIALGVAGAIFGPELATHELRVQAEALVGKPGGQAIGGIVANAHASGSGPVATALGLGAVAIGATAVFAQLQTALNRIWDVKPDPRRGLVRGLIRNRLLGLALALGTGFLLVVSLVLSAVLSATRDVVTQWIPSLPWLWRGAETATSFAVITALYMTIYKVLPDVRATWRDVAVGGAVSAGLFTVGKYAIGLYLGRMSIGSVYGAAGSFAVLLVWVYYTALMSFYGAEFTQVYARRYGSRIRPASYAVRRGAGKPASESPPAS